MVGGKDRGNDHWMMAVEGWFIDSTRKEGWGAVGSPLPPEPYSQRCG